MMDVQGGSEVQLTFRGETSSSLLGSHTSDRPGSEASAGVCVVHLQADSSSSVN